jgi:hypothetical protein
MHQTEFETTISETLSGLYVEGTGTGVIWLYCTQFETIGCELRAISVCDEKRGQGDRVCVVNRWDYIWKTVSTEGQQ